MINSERFKWRLRKGGLSNLREHPMRASDSQGPVADGKCDPFGGTATDVSRGKDPRARGLDNTGLAINDRPAVGFCGIRPRQDEALGIDRDARRQPASPRLRSDENKQRRAVEVARTPFPDVAQSKSSDRAIALDGVYLDVAENLDFRMMLNPAREVVGHALTQVAPA